MNIDTIFDELFKEPKERRAFLMTLFFLGIGIVTIWLLKEALGLSSDSILIAMLVLPMIVFLILSGRISEFKAPGGLEAKFREVARERVSVKAEAVPVEDVQALLQTQVSLKSIVHVRTPDPSKPLVLLVTLGNPQQYQRTKLLNVLKNYEQHRNFRFVVLRDVNGKLVCYLHPWAFRKLLENKTLGDHFVNLINSGDIAEVKSFPNIILEKISTNTTNIEALHKMTEHNLEAVLVTNEKDEVIGVCQRDTVISKLLLSLAQPN
jgi:CBS domain-containing protein